MTDTSQSNENSYIQTADDSKSYLDEPIEIDPLHEMELLAGRFLGAIKACRRSQQALKRVDEGYDSAILSVGGHEFTSEAKDHADGHSPLVLTIGKSLIATKAANDFENAWATLAEIKAMELPTQ